MFKNKKMIILMFAGFFLTACLFSPVYSQDEVPDDDQLSEMPPAIAEQVKNLYSDNVLTKINAVMFIGESVGSVYLASPYLIHVLDDHRTVLYKDGETGEIIRKTSPSDEASRVILDMVDKVVNFSDDEGFSENGILITQDLVFRKIVKSLKEEKVSVRVEVASLLGKTGQEIAIVPLLESLNDPVPEIREKSALAVSKLPGAKYQQLKELLNDPEPKVRRAAVKGIGNIGDPNSVKTVARMMKDPDYLVRKETEQVLVDIGEPAVSYLVSLSANRVDVVRWAAVRALGKIQDEKTIETLKDALNDNHWRVRQYAAEGLGNQNNRAAVSPLLRTYLDKNPVVKRAAQKSLVRLGNISVYSLIQAVDNPSEEEVRMAYEALLEITGEDFGKDQKAWMKWYDENIRQ